jgi:hypothetical protein
MALNATIPLSIYVSTSSIAPGTRHVLMSFTLRARDLELPLCGKGPSFAPDHRPFHGSRDPLFATDKLKGRDLGIALDQWHRPGVACTSRSR